MVFLIFLLTFLIPGAVLTFFFIRNREIDLLFFLIYLTLFGLAFQLVSSPFLLINKLIPVVLGVILAALILFFRRRISLRVRFDHYSLATLLLVILLLLLINSRVINDLGGDYFNPASDQYIWLALAERSLVDYRIAVNNILLAPIHRPVFFLTLSHYLAFLPKDLAASQGFILFWIYFNYALLAIVLSRLAAEILPTRTLGLLAPIAFFSLHWGNYYTLSTAVVPQNLGMFFLVAGFLFLEEKPRLWFTIFFLTLFYLIYLPNLLLFLFFVGAAKLLKEILRIFGFGPQKQPWHHFEVVAFLPTLIVAIVYLLFLLNIFDYYEPGKIASYSTYTQEYSLTNHTYVERYQRIIIWSALIGTLLAAGRYLSGKAPYSLLAVVFGLLLPWGFLKSSIVAYHAFYASWQGFRYYLILYPSLALLSLIPVSFLFVLIKKYFSPDLARGALLAIIIIITPTLLTQVAHQQGLVFLDMIKGRDGGAANQLLKKQIQDLRSLRNNLLYDNNGPIVAASAKEDDSYVQWAFLPNNVLFLPDDEKCDQKQCLLFDSSRKEWLEILQVAPVAAFIGKNRLKEQVNPELINELFKNNRDFGDNIFYYN